MSLRRIAPPLVCRCVVRGCISGGGGRANNPLLIPRRLDNNNATNSIAKRRGFSSTPKQSEKKMSAEEVDAALEQANESMKAYYSFPPEKLMKLKKAKFEERHRDKQFYLQLALGMTMLTGILITPFLGRKIAYDDEFKRKYVPAWYDFSIERPKSAWTRDELNEQVMKLRTELHERAIAGEFTPEKLEEMRRNLRNKPEREEHRHFAQLHPGVDDDEELEDD